MVCNPRGGGWSLGFNTSEKKKENRRPAATKVIIMLLRQYEDSKVVIYIACKFCASKLINQKTIILGKGK